MFDLDEVLDKSSKILSEEMKYGCGFTVNEDNFKHKVIGVTVGTHFILNDNLDNALRFLDAFNKVTNIYTVDELEPLFGKVNCHSVDFLERNGIDIENVLFDYSDEHCSFILHYYYQDLTGLEQLVLTYFPRANHTVRTALFTVADVLSKFFNHFKVDNLGDYLIDTQSFKPHSTLGLRYSQNHELSISFDINEDSDEFYMQYVYVNPQIDINDLADKLSEIQNEYIKFECAYGLHGIIRVSYSINVKESLIFIEDFSKPFINLKSHLPHICEHYKQIMNTLDELTSELAHPNWDSRKTNLHEVQMEFIKF